MPCPFCSLDRGWREDEVQGTYIVGRPGLCTRILDVDATVASHCGNGILVTKKGIFAFGASLLVVQS
jgi:hypothetical protein